MRDIHIEEWREDHGDNIMWTETLSGTTKIYIDDIRVTEPTRVIDQAGIVLVVDEGDPEKTDPQLLTKLEQQAMTKTAELWNILGEIVGDGDARSGDLIELIHHIHAIQHTIMGQAGARAYGYRLLGADALKGDQRL